MNMSKGITVLFLLLLCGCKNNEEISHDSSANQNVEIAFAYPMNEVEIDGNPEDWSDDMIKHPIGVVLENEIETEEDLAAQFKVGFSKESKSIYLLLSVKDESHQVDSEKGALSDAQDQCLMYLDKYHDAKGSGVNVYCFNALYQEIDDATTNWDPSARNPNWDNISVASQRIENQTYYEIKLTFEENVQEGKVIGLDFMIYDSDTQGEEELTRVAWQKTEGKEKVPFKIGSIVLVDDKEQLGIVEGQVKWSQDSIGPPPKKVRIASTKTPSLWVREVVDSTGNYTAKLPKGSYKVTPEWNFYILDEDRFKLNPSGITVDVKPDTKVNAAPLELSIAEPLNLIKSEGLLLENPHNKYELVDAFVASYMDYYEIPGVSLGLIENGKLTYHKTYGVKNVFTQASVEKETLFEAASITKPVFGFAVCRLADRGIIDLDQPLYTYLPFEEIAYDERYKKITARHVLSHQTGFPNWRDGEMKIEFEPGTQFGYSGEGFEYLKRVIAEITGKDVVQVLEEEVLNPLNLQNFYFEKNDYLFKVVANGHFNNHANMTNLPNKAGMAWSLHTEAKSFCDFAIAVLERRGLSRKTYADMFHHHTVTDKYEEMNSEDWKSYFGLGLQIEKTPFGNTFGHGGNNGDFKCEFKIYEELQKGFVIFTNSNTGGELAYKALDQFLITGKVNFKP